MLSLMIGYCFLSKLGILHRAIVTFHYVNEETGSQCVQRHKSVLVEEGVNFLLRASDSVL